MRALRGPKAWPKGPANGDSDTYMVMAGADSVAADDHFKAQAASIAAAENPAMNLA